VVFGANLDIGLWSCKVAHLKGCAG